MKARLNAWAVLLALGAALATAVFAGPVSAQSVRESETYLELTVPVFIERAHPVYKYASVCCELRKFDRVDAYKKCVADGVRRSTCRGRLRSTVRLGNSTCARAELRPGGDRVNLNRDLVIRFTRRSLRRAGFPARGNAKNHVNGYVCSLELVRPEDLNRLRVRVRHANIMDLFEWAKR